MQSVSRRETPRPWSWVGLPFAFAGSILFSLAACSGKTELTTELPGGSYSEAFAGSESSAGPTPAGARLEPGLGARGGDVAEGGPVAGGIAGGPRSTELDGRGAEATSGEVPNTDHCASVADWEPAWSDFEEQVLELVNEARSAPANCGSEGQFPAAPALRMDGTLRCSARLHSLDMYERSYFDHTTPDGEDPFQRMMAAGFRGSGAGENIAVGQTSPEQVMQSWMQSDGHCANVMRANYRLLGVGYHPGAGGLGLGSNYWTQNFGAPLMPRSCGRPSCR